MMLETIRTALSGYKTYLVSAVAVLTAVLAWIDGSAGLLSTINSVAIALGLGTLRAGVAAAVKTITKR